MATAMKSPHQPIQQEYGRVHNYLIIIVHIICTSVVVDRAAEEKI